jgi:hypothetical protein
MQIYTPEHNKQPHPSFSSILNGYRELDKNPEQAVGHFQLIHSSRSCSSTRKAKQPKISKDSSRMTTTNGPKNKIKMPLKNSKRNIKIKSTSS